MALPARSAGARRALGVFCAALFLFALTRQGHSAESVDVRTYVEMIRGVAEHGLPYLDNGPADRIVVLRAPWNVHVNGHYWGIYGPLYPYVAAPFLLVGGLRLVSVATFMLTIALALATFLLELTAYPLAVVLATASTHATLVAIREVGSRRLRAAAVAGILYALASATHLLCFPMSVALLGALLVCDASGARDDSGPRWLARSPFASFWPTRETSLSACVAAVAMGLLTLPVVALNHRRFAMWNPFTYGPTPWRGSDQNGVVDQTIGGHLRHAAPVLAVLLVAALATLVLRAIRPGRVVGALVGALCCAPLAVVPVLRERSAAYARTAFAYVVDQSLVTLEGPYTKVPGGFGQFFGPWVVKSTLQCTPLLILALALPKLEPRKRHEAFALLAPCVALYGYLVLRANLPLHSALGFPWVYIRYTLPGLPMLLTAALLVARETLPDSRKWIVAGAVAFVSGAWSLLIRDDESLGAQVALLVLPLLIGALALGAVLARRRGLLSSGRAELAVAAAAGISVGSSAFHDLHANIRGKAWCDYRHDVMARIAPQRFALLGYLPPMEPALSMRAERDVEYGDLFQVDDWGAAGPAIERWWADRRPIFFLNDLRDTGMPVSPWPGFVIETVDQPAHVFRIVRRGAEP
jgi:hypothetical protein